MKIFLAVVLLFTFTGTASATPKHWYKDWKWWVGAAVIETATIVDVQSTCRNFGRGYVESNFIIRGSTSCGQVAGLGFSFAALQVGLHAAAWHCAQDSFHPFKCYGLNQDDSPHKQVYDDITYTAIPAIALATHLPAAIRNYGLPDLK